MKMKTSTLEGAALDWAVAQCEGYKNIHIHQPAMRACAPYVIVMQRDEPVDWMPSLRWDQGGPIAEDNSIGTMHRWNNGWAALMTGPLGIFHDRSYPDEIVGPTPLIAAMRCYVASKLGEEVDVPEEAIK